MLKKKVLFIFGGIFSIIITCAILLFFKVNKDLAKEKWEIVKTETELIELISNLNPHIDFDVLYLLPNPLDSHQVQLVVFYSIVAPAKNYKELDVLTGDKLNEFLEKYYLDATQFKIMGDAISFAYLKDLSKYAIIINESSIILYGKQE